MRWSEPIAAGLLSVCLFAGLLQAQETKKEIPWGPNLAKNGSFEEGLGAYHFTRRSQVAIDTDVVYRGFNALKMQGEASTEKRGHNICVQGFFLKPKPTMQVLFRLAYRAEHVDKKIPPVVSFRYGIEGEKSDHAFAQIKDMMIKKDGDWTVYEVVVKAMPENANRVGFWFRVPQESGATLWVDDIQVRTYVP